MRGPKCSPPKEVILQPVAFGHPPDVAKAELVRRRAGVLTEDALEIYRHEPIFVSQLERTSFRTERWCNKVLN